MSNLAENNSKRVLLNVFFDHMDAFVYLVFPGTSENCVDQYIKVKIGNRRVVKIPGVSTENAQFMAYRKKLGEKYDKDPSNSHDIMDCSSVEGYVASEDVIDFMKYLDEKEIGTRELESWEYPNVKRRKVQFEDICIRGNGIFSFRHAYFECGCACSAFFFKDEVVIGKTRVSFIAIEDFKEDAAEYLSELVDCGKRFTSESLGELLRMGHDVIIATPNGFAHYKMLFGAKLEVEMRFQDGSYYFEPCADHETIVSKSWIAFVLGLLQAKSRKECLGIENKARLLGVL